MSGTPIADMVEQMYSTGIPPEAIVAAVRATELAIAQSNSIDSTANRRRAWDRNRKRLQKKPSTGIPVESGGIPPESENLPLIVTSLVREESKKDSTTTSSTGIPPEKSKRKTGQRLPEDWKPSTRHYEIGLEAGVGREIVDRLAVDMRLWEQANQNRAIAKKADWDATFSGWVRRSARPKPMVSGHGPWSNH